MFILIIAIAVLILFVITLLLFKKFPRHEKPIMPQFASFPIAARELWADGRIDNLQQMALTSPYKETLVIAGAGAGKTSVLTKRIILFSKYMGIPISKMMVMAFNKNAAEEVRERVGKATGRVPESLKPNIRTIHSIALETAEKHRGRLDIFEDDKKLENFVKEGLEEYRKKHGAGYEAAVVDLFGNADLSSLKSKNKKLEEHKAGIACSNGLKVRSHAERWIVERLLSEKIDFVYEPFVTWADRYFEPDFYFPKYDAYAEYWGLANHPNPFIRDRYKKQMEWKQEQFRKYGFYLIDLYESNGSANTPPDDYLVWKLNRKGLTGRNGPNEAKLHNILNTLEEQLVQLILDILNIVIGYGTTLRALLPKADPFMRHILKFAVPITDELEIRLEQKGKATFTHVLKYAVDAMENDKDLLEKLRGEYEHIFVDEVQDLQPLARKFIRLLTGERQSLFAIGDDYQSIYSFAGSDPLFMVRFESYFPQASLVKLQYNYRCHPRIVDISNAIIKNNRVQLFKKVEGKYLPGQKAEDKTLTLITLADRDGQKEMLVDYIMSKVPKKESLKILARYNFILEPYRDILTEEYPDRKYEFLTIHRSKGLESDNVLILDCVKNNDCKYCFPAEDHHQKIRDGVLRLCRGNKFNLEEEETRLFYVAVTRARRHVYVATMSGKQSEFTNEKYLPREMITEMGMG